ncbi:hypothetical protein ElyMa_006786700 [Elysia marginata]|uniref:Uncharacterized protein n=1 Tax=Elysia marginata TaxID=1093978 RepID=A0AAV4IZZ1_9GAST|nr:hypothetical protein ElyMa_006786700 [Elysia marginata]
MRSFSAYDRHVLLERTSEAKQTCANSFSQRLNANLPNAGFEPWTSWSARRVSNTKPRRHELGSLYCFPNTFTFDESKRPRYLSSAGYWIGTEERKRICRDWVSNQIPSEECATAPAINRVYAQMIDL